MGMTIDEAKAWLAEHPARQPVSRIACPPHSSYAEIDVRVTFERVRLRNLSLSGTIEEVRQREREIFKLKMVRGKVAA